MGYRKYLKNNLYRRIMKEIYNNNPIEDVSDINDGLLNIIVLNPPNFEDRESRVTYGWKLEEDYWVWMRRLLNVIEKKLRKQGLLILISKVFVKLLNEIIEKGFNLSKHYIWDNGKMRNVFVFTRDTKSEVKTLLRYYQEKYKITSKDINKRLGVVSGGGGYWSLYTGNNKSNQIPTLLHWECFQDIFGIDISYEDILSEFVEDKEEIWRGNQDYLYEKILNLNKKENSKITVWDIFGGRVNGLSVYERENISYFIFEYDKKKYYKIILGKKN